MVRVKICGITNLEDALFAANLGADALGFVFYKKSPRYISADKARSIITQLPPFIHSVGLFVNHTAEEIKEILTITPLSLLQFHGDENEDFIDQFQRPFIKAIRIKESSDFEDACHNFPNAQSILVDHYKENSFGGTGETFNWSLIPKQRKKSIILAGGLNCNNLLSAMKQISPEAVDVSSGVEKHKGIKDQNLIKKFINCAKSSIS
ncbi:phosphoribosylanthranilate isomerase [Thiotrichales bacterium 19S3-7]|nr:phosphoribosylanthranilate isomerase [Thiotrichales bacterium 19S3-7]MCF6802611.1 phosphoribosylanthranilate isomerase [Thiotrichales bacterium 19S3-11]